MKQIILLCIPAIVFFVLFSQRPQNPTSKVFKAAYVEVVTAPGIPALFDGDNIISDQQVNYYRIECPNNPVAYGCGTTGSIPCGAPKNCPVVSSLKLLPCPLNPGLTYCGPASSGTPCPNQTSCPTTLTLHSCPLDPGATMCASGGSGPVCPSPTSCQPPPVASQVSAIANNI